MTSRHSPPDHDSPRWPPHGQRTLPWQQSVRSGTRADRMLREIETSIPPKIAEQSLQIPAGLTVAIEEAAREVALLDSAHTAELGALSIMLLRTESVASSKIEQLE